MKQEPVSVQTISECPNFFADCLDNCRKLETDKTNTVCCRLLQTFFFSSVRWFLNPLRVAPWPWLALKAMTMASMWHIGTTNHLWRALTRQVHQFLLVHIIPPVYQLLSFYLHPLSDISIRLCKNKPSYKSPMYWTNVWPMILKDIGLLSGMWAKPT